MTESRIAGVRVLIVEDEAVVAEGIRERLGRHACEVVDVVDTGEEAVRSAEDLRPDLVLMDIRLRGRLDGVEAAAQIQRRLMIPVVFLTAHSDSATLDRAMQINPGGYLLKPFREAELLVAVEMAVKRHREAQRLHESNLSFGQILSSLDEATVTLDADHRVVNVNDAARRLLRLPQGPLPMVPLVDLITLRGPGEDCVLAGLLGAVTQLGRAFQLPQGLTLQPEYGGSVPVRGSLAPIVDFQGHNLGTVVALRDVSRQLELERRVLESERLVTVRLMAGDVAHELNNVLACLAVEQDLLLSALQPLDPSQRRSANAMQAAFDRATKITRRMQGLGRCGHARPEPICLHDVAKSFATRLLAMVEGDARFVPEAPAEHTWVMADPAHLEQALLQLAMNARDASPADEAIEVVVGAPAPRHDRFGGQAWIGIRDRGPGLSDDERKRVLSPFVTTKGEGAMGLGLTLVQDLIEQNNGALKVASTPDVGSLFRLHLPRIAPPPPLEVEETRRIEPTSGRVLLVDDEPMVLRVVARLVAFFGFEVVTAVDGKEAFDIWSQTPDDFCLVLTDLIMPKMGGRELVEAIYEEAPKTPMIVMSGYDGGWEGGGPTVDVPILRKPFRAQELQDTINRLLESEGRPMRPALSLL